VLTTGYANSSAPKTGGDIAPGYQPFVAGSGFAVGVRADLDDRSRKFWFTPSFLFWDNLTGAPDPNSRVNYFQTEVGARVYAHSTSNPTLYAGLGAGYSLAHGVKTAKADGSTETYDGDFPTASIHAGAKIPSAATGITVLAEASYHVGLEHPHAHLAIGPAGAALIQIGVAFDIVGGSQP